MACFTETFLKMKGAFRRELAFEKVWDEAKMISICIATQQELFK